MLRKIIHIDKEMCNGCGLCAEACHEGAIGMVDGKAQLLRDDYCDGLGDCLPVCPTGAITFEEREALEYNEAEVKKRMQMNSKAGAQEKTASTLPCGCPGTHSKTIVRGNATVAQADHNCAASAKAVGVPEPRLMQWPVQIKLVPVNAPYFEGANLLIAADCTAYAYGNFHAEFMKNKITVIGCPKLDDGDYSEKLSAILSNNNIKSLTIVRMEVPCCGGIEHAAKTALQNSGKLIPWRVVTISTDGQILED